MRVLSITNSYPPGALSGVGTLVQELSRALAAAGHEPVVWTRRATRAEDPFVVALAGGKLLFPLAAGWRLLTGGRAARFDAVHVHESDGVVALVALALMRWVGGAGGKARRVATLQVSYREERRTTRPVRDRGEIVSRPSAQERRFARWRAPLLALAGRLTARLADVVVAPSRRTALELARDYGARDVVVIPNGVPAVPPADVAAAPPVVLFAGRFRARKAVTVLVRAFAEVASAVPAARLVLAGDGEDRTAVEAEIRRLGLGGRVERLGAVTREEVARRLRGAAVFCLPSIYEGLPLAILEAMAAGVPVVATAVSGNPDAIVDGESGWLVAAEDSAALASALIHALADPAEARRRAAAASERFRERFEIGVVARSYLELLAAPAG